jgi:hypothetical protein
MQALLDWVRALAPVDTAFLADEQGLPVYPADSDPEQATSMATVLGLLQALREGGWDPAGGIVSVVLDDPRTLHFVEARTGWGRVGLALVSGEPLRAALLGQVQQALHEVFGG